jgi:hypothetical protein
MRLVTKNDDDDDDDEKSLAQSCHETFGASLAPHTVLKTPNLQCSAAAGEGGTRTVELLYFVDEEDEDEDEGEDGAANAGAARKRGESAEEKRQRKQQAKEQKQARRHEKKTTKLAFTAEKSKQLETHARTKQLPACPL